MSTLPCWFKQEIPHSIVSERGRILSELGVHTVCHEAGCPNLGYCFENLRFTFMVLGRFCTRSCRFCQVEKTRRGQLDVDWNEPYRIAAAVRKFKLTYCVITSVTRDDLPDGGAILFVKTIQLIHEISRDIQIEVLVPDFQGNKPSIKKIVAVQPDTMGHNIETVRRLYEGFRPEADYDLSLEVLRTIKRFNPKMITKSSLMLGLGEEKDEVIETMIDLRDSGCDVLTLGQYLAPSILHYPIKEFVTPQQFERYKKIGLQLGFKAVAAGPLVRSSYQAQEVFHEAKESKESWRCTI